MGLSDIADVKISTVGVGPTRQGFGVPLILSTKTAAFGGGRLLTFSRAASMLGAGGFIATDPEYLAVQAMYAQNPAPIKVMLGLLNNKPTQRFTITPTPVDNTKYQMTFNGVTNAIYTSGAGATGATVATGLQAAIAALALPNVTAAVVGSAVQLTAPIGGFIDVEPINGQGFGPLVMVEDNADPGVAADLGAFLALDSYNWYMIISPWASNPIVTAIETWAEGNERTYLPHTVDGNLPTALTTDVGSTSKNSAYARTLGMWHARSGAMIDAAWAGRCLPYDPGSETWKFKTLNGVPLVTNGVSDTQIANIRAKNWNFYTSIANVSITEDGITPAGEYFDIVRGRDWLKNSIQTAVFSRLSQAPKIPYTDPGAAVIAGIVKNQLSAAVRSGFLSPTPEPAVTTIPVAQQLQADRAARYMPNINFNGIMAGAIHKLQINGQLSV